MALVAKSQAILLDGLYNFITLTMAFISLKVIDLVNTPETKNRPFGYMSLEPFLNLTKSLIVIQPQCHARAWPIRPALLNSRSYQLFIGTEKTSILLYEKLACMTHFTNKSERLDKK